MEGINRRRLEIEVLVEPAGIVINRMHHNGSDPDDTGCLLNACKGIDQQSLAKSFSLLVNVNRQPGKQDDADGMACKPLGDPLGALMLVNRASGQSVITGNGASPNGYIGLC